MNVFDKDPNSNVMPFDTPPQPFVDMQETKPAVQPQFAPPPIYRPRPKFRIVCKKVRVADGSPENPRPGTKQRFLQHPRFGKFKQLGDVMFEELNDTDSVGASIGLSSEGAKASVGVSWSKVALIAVPILYLGWTKVLKNKGFGLPIIG